MADERFRWWNVSLLGAVTIVAYGTWYYSFGVLLDPILVDTQWPEAWVVASFGVAGVGGALAAPFAGRMVDQYSPRIIFAGTGTVASAGLAFASSADGLPQFVAGSALGGATLAAFGFYHVTQTAAIRNSPQNVAKAVALVTLFGAFASTIYLPLTAYLVDQTGWRSALRLLALISAVSMVAIAIVMRPIEAKTYKLRPMPTMALLSHGPQRRYAAATSGIGVASGIVLVYQVPLMTSAGLSLTAAAWLAGARGTTQFLGRLPITWLTARFGSVGSLQLAFGSITVGVLLLAITTSPVIGLGYVAVAGFGIGATSPLQGIRNAELFEAKHLGHAMGLMTMIFGLSGALGPAVVALLNDVADTRWWAISVSVTAALFATVTVGIDR